MGQEICIEAKCLKAQHSRSYCSNHYNKNIFYPANPTYAVWAHLIQRCYNAKDKRYPTYGGRGIIVCEQWRNHFKVFEADVGQPPSPRHQLDRINNDGNYEPGNCKWSTPIEQSRNRGVRSDNKSGVAGVTYYAQSRKWRAEITINKKPIYLGLFSGLKQAVRARKKAEREYHF